MADQWFENIQQRAQVEKLLEVFAARSGVIPKGSKRVRNPEVFPERLKGLLTRDRALMSVCFSRGDEFWLLTGIVCMALSRERNAPVLWVTAYSGDGAPLEMGAWTADLTHTERTDATA